MTRPLPGADSRPRVHIWAASDGFRGSIGPVAARFRPRPTIGSAVDDALRALDLRQAAGGVVIILEPIL